MSSKSIYKTSFCSCIICHKEYSARGIFSHYSDIHTIDGREKVKVRVSLGGKATAIIQQQRSISMKNEKELRYLLNPNICSCGKPKAYNQRNNKFCSSSCAATHTNKTRDKSCYERSKKALKDNLARQCFYPKPLGKITGACTVCNSPTINGRKSCSDACKKSLYAKGGRIGGKISAKNQIRRSKDEISLFNLLQPNFHKITHNDTSIAQGWDADILIYDIKTAILWNGPWHYREMGFLNHSLQQVQNRDRIKIEEFEKAGWKVLVFEDRYFTPKQAYDHIMRLAL